jgi:diguanylate cyclase (GGDEF)-like protein
MKAAQLEQRIASYADWVEAFRRGDTPPPIVEDERDPLYRLSQELTLLSITVARRERELRDLFALVHTVDNGVLLDDIFERIFKAFRGVIPFDRIGCAFLSDDGLRVTAYWAKSELGPVRVASGFSQPLAGSSLELVLASGRPRVLNDLVAYLAAKPGSVSTRLIVEEGGRSSLTCPLTVDGRAVGFLFFTSRECDAYHRLHESAFLQITSQVSSIIDKGRLYGQLVEYNRTLFERAEQLEVVATRDALTGVPNRRAIDEALTAALAGTPGRPVGTIMADIDHFKMINDTLGHATGDRVLREFAQRLGATTRTGDVVGRYGGEEFLVVLPDTSEQSLIEIANRLCNVVGRTPFIVDGRAVAVTASFGAAAGTSGTTPAADLCERADRALYVAKTGGRNRAVLDDSARAPV